MGSTLKNESGNQKPTDNTFVSDVRMAAKRAQFFSKGFEIGGPFSPIGRIGLSIPIRNAMWLIDLVPKPTTEDDFQFEILAIHWMAIQINKWIDNHLVENDEEAKVALAAFLSRIWFDIFKLEESNG